MSVSVVQTATATPFGTALTAGNTVFIIASLWASGDNTFTTSAPTLGGSGVTGTDLQQVTSPFVGGSTKVYQAIWMLPDVTGGQTSFGLTTSGGNANGIFAVEVAGLGASPALDQHVSNSGSADSVASGTTSSTLHANEFVLGAAAIYSGSGGAPSGGWTTWKPASQAWGGYQIAAAKGATFSWAQTASAPQGWAAGIITVAGSSPGGGAASAASAVPALIAAGVI